MTRSLQIGFILAYLLLRVLSQNIQSYDDCIKAGYSATDSFPPTCQTNEGKIFTKLVSKSCKDIKLANCDREVQNTVCGSNGLNYKNNCKACENSQVSFYILGDCQITNQIQNYDQCVNLGYPILESYPQQCSVPNVRTFIEEIQIQCTPESKKAKCYWMEYFPVCGDNKVEYLNSCEACASNQIDSYKVGKCKDLYPNEQTINNFDDCVAAGFPIQDSFPEQCTTDDGRTFVNSRVYICTQEQKQNNFCTKQYSPVCGDNKVDYSNGCVACSSNQIDSYQHGQCKTLYPDDQNINNFDDCVAAGFPIQESFPEQCTTDDGRTFVNSRVYICTQEQKQNNFCTKQYSPVCGDNKVDYSNGCVACSSNQIDSYQHGQCKTLYPDDQNINNFDDCVAAGFPIQESFPEQCTTDDGRTFVNSKVQICTQEQKQNHFCTKEYNPVCGDNKVDYSNGCVACSSNQIDSYQYGKCKDLYPNEQTINNFDDCVTAGFPIQESFPEQCTTDDDRTFVNSKDYICTQEQKENKLCTREYNPVCGDNQIDYPNSCVACSSKEINAYKYGQCKDLYPNVQAINNFEDCVAAGFPILKSNPEQCVTDDGRTFINQMVYVCTQEQKETFACTMEYIPVCGDNGVTYGNKCSACSSGQIQQYTIGECKNLKNDQDINSFLDCIMAGYIQVDENPAKCVTSDGKIFFDDNLIECGEKFQSFECQSYEFNFVCGDDRQTYENPCEACQNNNYFFYGQCSAFQNMKETNFQKQQN